MSDGPGVDKWGRVPVKCFGRHWFLRDAPAIEWIMASLSDDLAGVFPGLVDDSDAMDLFATILAGQDMHRRCANVARKALDRASRREWHWVVNFAKEVTGSWTHVNGLLVRHGVRADQTPLADWIDAAYVTMLERLDKDGTEAFNQRLRKIPGGAHPVRPRMSSRADLLAFAKD